LAFALVGSSATIVAAEFDSPRSLDDRVVIELFSEHPAVVTPTGIAVDPGGRVLVIESHTHFRPEGYPGPAADRILMFAGANSDGRGNPPTVFFEGTTATMNLAVHPNGWVYVATRAEVFRIRDSDNDGRADRRDTIVRHETDGDYPHNGLSGFAFDFNGNVYFGQGENLGATYDLVGADGTTISGGGEGGNIYRCDEEGNNLVRIATGFWNPFHVCFDTYGRLFTVDNDPDSRPPCRLLHVVDGGDYGFRFRNGRRGLHPFTAWNGELPGTLPMVAGTGEAPSAVVCYESDALPDDYRGALLTTSWGDHRIERFDLVRRGASLRSVAKSVVLGGEEFRPVGMVQAPDGSLYVSDWVDKSYELHGRGRIWRIRSRKPGDSPRPEDAARALHSVDRPLREAAARGLAGTAAGRDTLRDALRLSDDAAVRLTCWWALGADVADDHSDVDARSVYENESSSDVRAAMLATSSRDAVSLAAIARDEFSPVVQAAALRRMNSAGARNTDERNASDNRVGERALLLGFLQDSDPFLRQAAREAIARVCSTDDLLTLAGDEKADARLAAVLLLRREDAARARHVIPRLLGDADPRVRFCTIQWIGESGLKSYREPLRRAMATAGMTQELFGAHLATLRMLDHGAVTPASVEVSSEEFVAAILLADDTPDEVRARALRLLPARHSELALEQLTTWLGSVNPSLALEALRTLRERDEPAARQALLSVAADVRYPHRLRAEAVAGLFPQLDDECDLLVLLATGGDAVLRDEALRSLRGATLSRQERGDLEHLRPSGPEVASLVDRVFAGGSDPLADLSANTAPDTPAPSIPVTDTEKTDLALPATATNDTATNGTATNHPDTNHSDTNHPQWLQRWLDRLCESGDPEIGERVFFHPQGPGCYRCHQIDGRGSQVGPDLSTTARQLSRERLVASIVAPSTEIAPRYVTWTLVLDDGRVLSGMLVGESADGTSTYANATAERFTVRHGEVEQRQQSSRSIMPDGLPELMTPGEFRDLLAYLQQRR
jgi:putative membrane-bound dehydrogenase-like protein